MYSTEKLYDEFLSLQIISERELYIVAYKIINGLINHSFALTKIKDRHDYNTRRRSNYQIKTFKTAALNNNVLYRSLNIFNYLPYEIKYSRTIQQFRKKIDVYLRNK